MTLRAPLVLAIAASVTTLDCDRSTDGFSVACKGTPAGATFATVDARLSAFGAKSFEIIDGFAWRRSNLLGTRTDACDVEFDGARRVVRTGFFAATP